MSYDIGPNSGQWIIGQQQFGNQSGSDGGQPIFSPVGRDGISPELAASIGYTPPGQNWGGVDSGNQVADPAQDFAAFLASKGLRLGQKVAPGTNQAYQQLFDAQNNPVGQQYNANLEQDPGGIFGAAVLAAAGFGGASALGAFGGAGGGISGLTPAESAGVTNMAGDASLGGLSPAAADAAYGPAATGTIGGASADAAALGGGAAGSGAAGGGLLGSGMSLGDLAGAAKSVAPFAPIIGGLLGAAGAGSGLNSASTTTQNKLDPRIAQYLYGANGSSGLLGNAANLYNQQMSDPGYMQGFNQMRQTGMGLLSAPQAGNPFTSGQMRLGGQNPASLMQAGQSFVPGRMTIQQPGLLGSK